MKVIEQACPGLGDLIEKGAPDEETKEKAAVFVQVLLKKSDNPPDAILLGCTHYSFKHRLFAELIPDTIQLFDQPKVVAKSLADYLIRHQEITQQLRNVAGIEYIATGKKG